MTVFFAQELETVATYWRIYRRDGVTLAFTSHDRALRFNGICHHAAPGMVPSAIRLTDSVTPDSAEVDGALTHDLISETDLRAGLYDRAQIAIGAVNWRSFETISVYAGTIGSIEYDGLGFSAELRSAKHALERDLVPRTSPACRAVFCDRDCGLNGQAYTHMALTTSVDSDLNHVTVTGLEHSKFLHGSMRFLAGPQAGIAFGISGVGDGNLVLDKPLSAHTPQVNQVQLREGCDHTFATCRTRFGNAVNFRGEPFLPGNDLLARYPAPQ